MQHKMSRRAMVKRSLLAGALVPALGLIGNGAEAAALTPLDPNDPQAKGLNFATDGSKVNTAANPTFKRARSATPVRSTKARRPMRPAAAIFPRP